MKLFYGLLVTSCLLFANAHAIQVDTVWTKSYSLGGNSALTDIAITSDGGFVGAGSFALQGLVMRFDSLGDTLWTRTLTIGTSETIIRGFSQTADGSILVTGNARTDSPTYSSLPFVTKFSSLGDSLWTRTYLDSIDNSYGSSVYELSNGDLLLGGFIWYPYNRFFAMRMDSVGQVLWTQTYYVLWSDIYNPDFLVHKMIPVPSGGFVLLGQAGNGGEPVGYTAVQKISENGDSLWQQAYWNSYTFTPWDLAFKPDGGFYVAVTEYLSEFSAVPVIMEADSLGNYVSEHSLPSGWPDFDIQVLINAPDSTFFYTSAGRVARLDAGADTLWSKDYSSLTYSFIAAATISAGDYLLAGLSNNNAYLAKIRAAECVPDSPLPPQNVNITPQGGNAVVSWSPVDYAENGCIIDVTHYLVFYAENSEGPSLYHGYTTATSYTHVGAVAYAPSMFYQVIASADPIPTALRDTHPGSLTMRQALSLFKTDAR